MTALKYLQNVIDVSTFTWISDARPKRHMPRDYVERGDDPVHDIQKPESASWPVLLSAAQVWEFLEGFAPKESEDKWLVFSEFTYAEDQPRLKKSSPNNVNGSATVRICHAASRREIYRIEIDIEYIDVVARAHPAHIRDRFEYDEMLVAIIRKVTWETSENVVEAPTEIGAKRLLKEICLSVLGISLLVNDVTPIRMEDQGSLDKMRDFLKAKLDLEQAMLRLKNNPLRLLAGGQPAMAAILSRGIQGASRTTPRRIGN